MERRVHSDEGKECGEEHQDNDDTYESLGCDCSGADDRASGRATRPRQAGQEIKLTACPKAPT